MLSLKKQKINNTDSLSAWLTSIFFKSGKTAYFLFKFLHPTISNFLRYRS